MRAKRVYGVNKPRKAHRRGVKAMAKLDRFAPSRKGRSPDDVLKRYEKYYDGMGGGYTEVPNMRAASEILHALLRKKRAASDNSPVSVSVDESGLFIISE